MVFPNKPDEPAPGHGIYGYKRFFQVTSAIKTNVLILTLSFA